VYKSLNFLQKYRLAWSKEKCMKGSLWVRDAYLEVYSARTLFKGFETRRKHHKLKYCFRTGDFCGVYYIISVKPHSFLHSNETKIPAFILLARKIRNWIFEWHCFYGEERE
jgi:hypothetical protein